MKRILIAVLAMSLSVPAFAGGLGLSVSPPLTSNSSTQKASLGQVVFQDNAFWEYVQFGSNTSNGDPLVADGSLGTRVKRASATDTSGISVIAFDQTGHDTGNYGWVVIQGHASVTVDTNVATISEHVVCGINSVSSCTSKNLTNDGTAFNFVGTYLETNPDSATKTLILFK